MKFYGHADLSKNEIQNAALTTLSTFPSLPVVGMLAFVNSIVYICVTAGSLPVWVPLTREITAYTHTQDTESSTWSVTHDLNTTSVNIQVYDGTNNVLIPNSVVTTGPNTCNITFGSIQAGRAVVITGHFDGNVKPTYAYTFHQTTASSTWVIVHNLGYNPIVRVFIGTSEVQPTSIVHDSINQMTITFSSPQVGYARLI
jgi:hypothetical protein